jgi:hypothetical protein
MATRLGELAPQFSNFHCLVILSFVAIMLARGLECVSAEECDYKTCGALMARDASVSWAVSGRHDYSPDTKQACAEFNACVRRAKNNSAGRTVAVPAAPSSSLESSSPTVRGPATQRAAPGTVGSSPAAIGSILRASCGPDMQKLCAGARKESEALTCLDAKRMELSVTCSLYFQKLGAGPTGQPNALNKKPELPATTTPNPVQKKKPPSPLPTTPIPALESTPNKKPPPTTTPIPD